MKIFMVLNDINSGCKIIIIIESEEITIQFLPVLNKCKMERFG